MAHKKGVGSSRNNRDSQPKMLGVKRHDGQLVRAGTIIIRQRGTRIRPGDHVGRGNDDTLFALIDGRVKFGHHSRAQKKVSVVPAEIVVENNRLRLAEVELPGKDAGIANDGMVRETAGAPA